MPVEDLEQLYALLPERPKESQGAAVRALKGPQLIIAGPGSGKTQVLVERALHLLLIKKVPASRVLLCIYTNKAAASLSDRFRRAIPDAGAETEVDRSEAWIGTFPSICTRLIDEYPDEAGLAKGYTILDRLRQPLFIHDNFDNILPDQYALEMGRRKTIKRLGDYFNKIVEDLVDVRKLRRARDTELRVVGRAFAVWKSNFKRRTVLTLHISSPLLSHYSSTRRSEPKFGASSTASWWMSTRIRTSSKPCSLRDWPRSNAIFSLSATKISPFTASAGLPS
nr:UvrD-helicase domain-containing protein [Ferrimicrobium acidiphilum]